MAASIRNRCFIEMLFVVLAAAVPATAQIEAHGFLSGCYVNKTLPDYLHELGSSPHTSLTSYCGGELLLQQRKYQASVNAFRDALHGDGNPAWTRVWSYIEIGKIFDITHQRERAVAQYQLAIKTGDNTDGAVKQARELLEHPFQWSEDR